MFKFKHACQFNYIDFGYEYGVVKVICRACALFHSYSLYFCNMEKRKLANSELIRKSVSEFKEARKTPLIVILDNVRSLNNIGSIFRTCDAFLIQKIYLCGISATPPHKDINKTALGATETVAWEYAENVIDVVRQLQQVNFKVFAVEQAQNSVMLQNFLPEPTEACAVIFGNEVKGVQQEVVNACNGVIEIPQLGSKHSLNIAVSAGIVIWDLFKKLSFSPSRDTTFSH